MENQILTQAVDFHEAQVAVLRADSTTQTLDNPTYALHLYALANCLWESEVVENVVRAKNIAKQLFDHNERLRSEVCAFLLDLLMELGEWEDAVLYLNKMPEDKKESEVFMFSSALVVVSRHLPEMPCVLPCHTTSGWYQ